ncbi:MAG: extracellular solute-binding protein, partial [Candidatus Promineifilaceae bacterium]
LLLALFAAACSGPRDVMPLEYDDAETNNPEVPALENNVADSGGEVAPVEEAVVDNSAELTTIVVWAEPWTARHMVDNPEADGRYGLALKRMFEEQNPGFTVSLEDHSWDNELRANFMTSLMGGTAPDVVAGENFFKQYVDLGAVIPLDEYIVDIKDDLIPGTYQTAQVDGSIYGISSFAGVFGFERNCTVIEAAGLTCDSPATWDDLWWAANEVNTAGMATAAAGGEQVYGFSLQGPIADSVGSVFRIAVLLAQTGAELCQNECSYPYFNDPKAVQVYDFLRAMNALTPPGLTFEPDEGKVYSQLFEGKSAYQIAGSWHPNWASSAGCTDCRYGGVPVAPGGTPANVIVGNGIYAVTAQSKYPQQAANFVKLLASAEAQDLIYSAMGRLPTTRSGLEALRPNVTEAEQAYIDELLNNPALRVLPSWEKNPQQVWTIYNEMLTEILTSDRPVQEIMDEAQIKAELAVR